MEKYEFRRYRIDCRRACDGGSKELIHHPEDEKENVHGMHHEIKVAEFRKRFVISVVLTVSVLFLTPSVQNFFGFSITILGYGYVLFAISAIIFFYGGYPFLKGFLDELRTMQIGMMTLISLATTVAFVYSSLVVFGLEGEAFFWELVTLIDIMLLGQWLEVGRYLELRGLWKSLQS
jgi:Cu2+-exporting ATPase